MVGWFVDKKLGFVILGRMNSNSVQFYHPFVFISNCRWQGLGILKLNKGTFVVSGMTNDGDVNEFNEAMCFEDGCNFVVGSLQREMVYKTSTRSVGGFFLMSFSYVLLFAIHGFSQGFSH